MEGVSTRGCCLGWVGGEDAGGAEHPWVLFGVGLEMEMWRGEHPRLQFEVGLEMETWRG